MLGAALWSPIAHAQQTESFNLGLRGVYFVENQGQWSDSSIEYGFRAHGLNVGFGESMLTMHIARKVASTSRAREEAVLGDDLAIEIEQLTLTVSFPGSNPVFPIGAKPQAAKFNYFIGDNESKWRSNVASFGTIVYENLYDGIDLHVMGSVDGVLKYEFHCAPGANYSRIEIAYDGIDSLCVDGDGNLQIETALGTLRDGAPLVWQSPETSRAREEAGSLSTSGADPNPLPDGRGSSDEIDARFELINDRTYRIALDGAVDASRALVIDPDVEWMRYLGGDRGDDIFGVAQGQNGDYYVTGTTHSDRFEQFYNPDPGWDDGYLARVSPVGELVWVTFLGTDWRDVAYSIALDSEQHAIVAGFTASQDFPRRINEHFGGWDGYVLRIDPDGQLQWMSYVGGTGYDRVSTLTLDDEDRIYIGGSTDSEDFEGRINEFYGIDDAFVARVSSQGVIEWMSYVGGTGHDLGHELARQADGQLILAGATKSRDLVGRRNERIGGIDGFIASISPEGAIDWTMYLGGSEDEGQRTSVATGTGGEIFVTGETESTDFNGRIDASFGRIDTFVARVDTPGEVAWMTYLGGARSDKGRGIAYLGQDRLIVTGDTLSWDLVARTNDNHGTGDGFVSELSLNGQIKWSLFLGGSDGIEWTDGISVDTDGEHVIVFGTTFSEDFEGAINQPQGSAFSDGFLVRIATPVVSPSSLTVESVCPDRGLLRIDWAGTAPNARVAVVYSPNSGALRIPRGYFCSGTSLELDPASARVALTDHSDANGSGSFAATAPPSACGGYLQLIDLTTCATSNVARIE